jgi:epoxide hydrolase
MRDVEPAPVAVPDTALDDLRDRLARTRWPGRELVADGSQGVRLSRVQELCEHWRTAYDWRRCEAMLNGWHPQRTRIDGVDVHLLHVRSPRPDALPLVMTHGWPGSVVEFHKVVGPLTDPQARRSRGSASPVRRPGPVGGRPGSPTRGSR